MACFLGEFETVIDAKHRLAIASYFRETIVPDVDGKDWVLVLGPGKRLWLYPDAAFLKLTMSDPVKSSPFPSRQTDRESMMYAFARTLKSDTQGRVVLPEKSMERAGLVEKDITLVGKRDHIEIWPTSEWERHVEAMMPSYSEMLYDAGERHQAGGQ